MILKYNWNMKLIKILQKMRTINNLLMMKFMMKIFNMTMKRKLQIKK